MSEDIYVFEAIDVEPAITETEVQARITTGEYQEITWEDDGRIGDGYFVKVGEHGIIGIAMIPDTDENGKLRHRGVGVQANPLDEYHQDSTIEADLHKIVDDFGTAPDGTIRRFERAIHIEKGNSEHKIFVRDGQIIRERVDSETMQPISSDTDEPLLPLAITQHEANLLRQMIALDIHDHKSGDIPGDSHDPGYVQRRIEDCQALLSKVNDLLS